MSTYTDVDRLILERWNDVRDLFEAYEQTQDRIGEMLEEVGKKLERWLEGQGYRCDLEKPDAAFNAWKPSWEHRRDGEMIWLSVGAVAPLGYRKVEASHPYLWVFTHGLESLRFKDPDCVKFGRDLRASLGPEARKWEHRDVKDASEPLGRYLTEVSEMDRVRLVQNPEDLLEFTQKQFQELFTLSASIDAALEKVRP